MQLSAKRQQPTASSDTSSIASSLSAASSANVASGESRPAPAAPGDSGESLSAVRSRSTVREFDSDDGVAVCGSAPGCGGLGSCRTGAGSVGCCWLGESDGQHERA